jgi:hypothetical protein
VSASRKNFFISRAGPDAAWARWIAHVLEEAGYSTFLQDWDFAPGQSFIENMRRGAECEHTLALLSPDYFRADFTNPEWEAALVQDPRGTDRRLIPVRVRACEVPPFLAHYIYIDLVGKGEEEARCALLEGVDRPRGAPSRGREAMVSNRVPPAFPARHAAQEVTRPTHPLMARRLSLSQIQSSFERAALELDDEHRDAANLLLSRLDHLQSEQRLFGQDTNRQHDIWRIVYDLNRLFAQHLGRSLLESVTG